MGATGTSAILGATELVRAPSIVGTVIVNAKAAFSRDADIAVPAVKVASIGHHGAAPGTIPAIVP